LQINALYRGKRWSNLPAEEVVSMIKVPAKLVGGLWLVAGLLYYAVRTRGFRGRPIVIDFSES
jgi:hypothetical protein